MSSDNDMRDTLWNSLRPTRWLDEVKLEEKIMYTSQFGYMDEEATKVWMQRYRNMWMDDPAGDKLEENLKLGEWDS